MKINSLLMLLLLLLVLGSKDKLSLSLIIENSLSSRLLLKGLSMGLLKELMRPMFLVLMFSSIRRKLYLRAVGAMSLSIKPRNQVLSNLTDVTLKTHANLVMIQFSQIPCSAVRELLKMATNSCSRTIWANKGPDVSGTDPLHSYLYFESIVYLFLKILIF